MNSAPADFHTLSYLNHGVLHHPNYFCNSGVFFHTGECLLLPSFLNSLLFYYQAPVIVIFLRIL